MVVRTRRAVFTILVVFLFFSAHSVIDSHPIRACDLPVQSQTYEAEKLEKGQISVNLKTIFTQQDITKIETSVNTCRVSISQKIQQFQYEISNLLQDKANLQGYANIRDTIKRFETLKSEKKNIYETMGRDLSQISFRGIYGTILEMVPGTSRKTLLMEARRLIAPSAIHDLRGVAVSAVTEASSSQVVFDRIVAETSGEMDIETTVLEERKFFKGKTQLLYVAVVSVKPMKGAVQKAGATDMSVSSAVVDILTPGGAQRFKGELAGVTSAAYAEGKVNSLSKIVEQWASVILNGNGMATKRERSILMDLDRKLTDKDDQIRSAQGMVERSRANLARLYQNIGFTACQGHAERCLSPANKYIDDKIEKLVDRSMVEKEKELVFRKDRIRGEGDPAQEIRDLACDLCKNLKTTYGQREQFLRLSVSEMGVLVKDVKDQGYYIQRHPRQGWIYPYADDRGDLWFLVAMNFRVERGGRGAGEGATPKTFTNSIGMKFIPIPNGTFMMGSKLSASEIARKYGGKESDYGDEHPQHPVTISKPFYMQTTEVTQGQWQAIMGNNPARFKRDNNPVEKVSWNDAKEFIRKLNRKEGTNKYRLPTEAEWEYACRAGTTAPFYTGDCISMDQANYDGNYPGSACSKGVYREKTVEVGSFAPNPWGLYDMHGNVWEWCEDWYGNYIVGAVTDPKGPSSGSVRVLRGGSWSSDARYLRSADRGGDFPGFRYNNLGFRIVRAQ